MGMPSPTTSRTSSSCSARNLGVGQRSALVSTTLAVAPQSSAITRERAIRSSKTPRLERGCATSTSSTLAARVWRSPRELPRQRATSLSRGSTATKTPMSWPSGQRATTQSPTAARSSVLSDERPCPYSQRPTLCSQQTTGKPRSSRSTQPSASSPASAPPEATSSREVSKNAWRWRSEGTRAENGGKPTSERSAESLATIACRASPRCRRLPIELL